MLRAKRTRYRAKREHGKLEANWWNGGTETELSSVPLDLADRIDDGDDSVSALLSFVRSIRANR